MNNGTKYDAGKDRWDLWPWRATREIMKVIMFGAGKYGTNNWRGLPDARVRYYAALQRHLIAWHLGERCDPESGIHHLAHAGCNVLFLLAFEVGFDPLPSSHDEERHNGHDQRGLLPVVQGEAVDPPR